LDVLKERERRGEEAPGFLNIRPSLYWTSELTPLDGDNGRNKEYEGPFLRLDRWYVCFRGLNDWYPGLSAMAAMFPVTRSPAIDS
jgi:hypothetical protein